MSEEERERSGSTDRERSDSTEVEAHRAGAAVNEEPTEETADDDVEAHRAGMNRAGPGRASST